MTAMTLTEFLLERIAEDESAARPAKENGLWGRLALTVDWATRDVDGARTAITGWDTRFLSSCDPTRVLAECGAKRRIVAAHPIVSTDLGKGREGYIGFGCETCHAFDGAVSDGGYCDTMLALAAVYADHPDCDESWRA